MASRQAQLDHVVGAEISSLTEFEKKFGQTIGSKYCLAVNSGTSAIHLALLSLGVGPGDEVLCPTYTYVATVNPILYIMARPVLVDSEDSSWNICPDLVETAVVNRRKQGRNPKAIIIVHINGVPANLKALVEIANKFEIPVIEDAAQALGSSFQKQHVGTVGDIGTFSFNDNKILTTYGGGMMVTNQKDRIDPPIFLSSQAKSQRPFYEHTKVGFNYRMNRLAAEFGVLQLPYLKENLYKKRQIWNRYKDLLQDIPGITFQEEFPNSCANRWISAVRFKDHEMAGNARKKLSQLGFGFGFGWRPMHQQPVFNAIPCESRGVADALFNTVLHLPSHLELSISEQHQIAEVLEKLNY